MFKVVLRLQYKEHAKITWVFGKACACSASVGSVLMHTTSVRYPTIPSSICYIHNPKHNCILVHCVNLSGKFSFCSTILWHINCDPELNKSNCEWKVGSPIKLRYPSPPRVCVMNLIILCRAMPRSMMIDGDDIVDILLYISASMSQNARVLSPTSAWSWLSQYAMFLSPWRRFVRFHTMSATFQSLSAWCFRICRGQVQTSTSRS